MRILHTSDWHLGNRLYNQNRDEEFQLALDWLLDTIRTEKVEVLVVAGDIFDVTNPSNVARKQYYHFLSALRNTTVRHTIIIGGNHDSPSMLDAPSALLSAMQIHVMGSTPKDLYEAVWKLNDADGNPELIVAAVPFLRDQDLRSGDVSETGENRVAFLRKQIANHYQKMGVLVEEANTENLPVIATGHLCVSGAEDSKEKSYIFIGDNENIRSDQFPEAFDYVALGHIHRPQMIGGQANIRYCGSLIPLSFSEARDQKKVVLFEFEGKKLTHLREIEVPTWRRLKSISAPAEQIADKLKAFADRRKEPLPAWVELRIEDVEMGHQIERDIRDLAKAYPIEILAIRLQKRTTAKGNKISEALESLPDEQIFQLRLDQTGYSEEEQKELKMAYEELKEWMKSED